MAIAPQSAMPYPPVTTRPQPAARTTGVSRHALMSPMPEPRLGGVVVRLAALILATAFAVGCASAVALAIVTGTLTQLSH
ncbi:MAG: hypothetical protein QOI55_1946 [Actinomycetota bacterium]|nr:hypothetical protein [Actinomycetota bacterium]